MIIVFDAFVDRFGVRVASCLLCCVIGFLIVNFGGG